MKLTPIAIIRAVNVFLTSINAGIGAVALPDPYNVIAPLVLGAIVQALAELVNASMTKQPDAVTMEPRDGP